MSVVHAYRCVCSFDSPRPSDSYMRRYTRPWLLQTTCQISCHLLGSESLSEPVQVYWQLKAWKQISVKFESKYSAVPLRGPFSPKFSQKTHHRYGIYFVGTESYSCRTSVIVPTYSIAYFITPRQNGPRLYSNFHTIIWIRKCRLHDGGHCVSASTW